MLPVHMFMLLIYYCFLSPKKKKKDKHGKRDKKGKKKSRDKADNEDSDEVDSDTEDKKRKKKTHHKVSLSDMHCTAHTIGSSEIVAVPSTFRL